MKYLVVLLSLAAAHLSCAQAPASLAGAKFDGSKNILMEQVLAADRIVIRTCGLLPAEKKVSHVIMEIKGAKEVADFLQPFQLFGPLEPSPPCACSGDPTFEIYKGDVMVTQFALKHGMGIVWPGAWPLDMFTSSKGAVDDFFVKIANLGYPVYMHQKQIMRGMLAYLNQRAVPGNNLQQPGNPQLLPGAPQAPR